MFSENSEKEALFALSIRGFFVSKNKFAQSLVNIIYLVYHCGMKANELRIGNKVYDTKGDVNTVCVETFVKFNPQITAIPLTEQWLLRMGFELRSENSNMWDLKSYKEKTNEAANRGQGFLCVVDFRVKHDFWLDLQTRRTFHYVHELQNLYFAITGTELEIKEQL